MVIIIIANENVCLILWGYHCQNSQKSNKGLKKQRSQKIKQRFQKTNKGLKNKQRFQKSKQRSQKHRKVSKNK